MAMSEPVSQEGRCRAEAGDEVEREKTWKISHEFLPIGKIGVLVWGPSR